MNSTINLDTQRHTSEALDEDRLEMLTRLLRIIIPPDSGQTLPSAAEIDFLSYVTRESLFSFIDEGLGQISKESNSLFRQPFNQLADHEQLQLVKALKRAPLQFFNRLVAEVITCYYLDHDVRRAHGLRTEPPFPSGTFVTQLDFTLLETVHNRGPIYRD